MDIPLFPLHTVLCPGIVLPLHIFEERYRALTRHCLDTGDAVRRRPDPRGPRGRRRGAVLAGVGAFAEIREAGRYPDGRYDLLAAATGRFAIESVDPGREPYLVADVTPLEDEVGDEPRAERLSASAIRRFVRYLELMRARDGETTEVLDIRVELDSSGADETETDDAVDDASTRAGRARRCVETEVPTTDGPTADRRRDLVIPDDPTVLSYLLSGIVQLELPRRQALLEAATTVEPPRGAHPPSRPRGPAPGPAVAPVLA